MYGNKVFTFDLDASGINDFFNTPEWSGIGFDDTAGIWLSPVSGIDSSYDSNGYLTNWEIDAFSSYTSFGEPTTSQEIFPNLRVFDPSAADVGTGKTHLKLDGITVGVDSPGGSTLTFVNSGSNGQGIGITGNGSDKISGSEILSITMDQPSTRVRLDIADLTSHELKDGLDFFVYVEGQSQPIQTEFQVVEAWVIEGSIQLDFKDEDFGGKIERIDIFSAPSSDGLGTLDFTLQGVEAEFQPEAERGTDIFEYAVTDSDGDEDTAFLVLHSGNGEAFNGTQSAETLNGTINDDVFYSAGGNDVLFGNDGADTFVFLDLNDGQDTIQDFDLSDGDKLDLSQLIETYSDVNDAIEDFVFAQQVGNDTVISFDQTGSGNISNATKIVTLEDFSGTVSELVNTEALVA